MREISSLRNDFACEVYGGDDDGDTCITLRSTNFDLRDAAAGIQRLRQSLERLRFTRVVVWSDMESKTLWVTASLKLPFLFRQTRMRRLVRDILAAYTEHLTPFVRFKSDAVLGKLLWHENYSMWSSKVMLDGCTVELNLWDEVETPLEESIEQARELICNWPVWRKRIEEAQVSELLPLYNDNWKDPTDNRIDAKELLSRLSLMSITCGFIEMSCVTFTQRDLFTDHDVEMRISPDGTVEAVLQG